MSLTDPYGGHLYLATVSRSDELRPPLVYFYQPRPVPGQPAMRVMMAEVSPRGCDPGLPLVYVDLDTRMAREVVRLGGLPAPLAAELRHRADAGDWKPTGQARFVLPDGTSLDPTPYFERPKK